MKKTALFLLVLCVVAAFAGYVERTVWKYDGSNWVGTYDARKWLKDNVAGTQYGWEQNLGVTLYFEDSCEVAQWIKWYIEGREELWRVRNSGTYAGKGPRLWFWSSGNVTIDFDFFANLGPDGPNSNNYVEKFYGFGPADGTGAPGDIDPWMTPGELNAYTYTGTAWDYYIWEAITVGTEDAPGIYANTGRITLALAGQNPAWFGTDASIAAP